MKRDVYRMAKRPAFLPVKRREDFARIEAKPAPEVVTLHRGTECHVTPPEVAARMVEYLPEDGAGLTLEPSAGTGNLSRALIDAGQDVAWLVQVEREAALFEGLRQFGRVVRGCFLDYAQEVRGKVDFARVVMNPPFREVRQHVAAARSLLAPGGVLVALVPVTFKTDNMETLEHLPEDTFATARVRTKIIRIRAD